MWGPTGFHPWTPVVLIYINDICAVSKELDFISFADDTNVDFSHKNLNSLIQTVNSELIKLTSWFQVNRLSIDIKKTKYVLFKPGQKRQTLDHLTVKLCDRILARESETVFLGVILDEHLSWKSHIAYLASKVSRPLGVISKSSFYLYKSALHTLHFSLVHPYLQYCIRLWGSTYPTNLKRLVLLQKRAMRIISKSCYADAHTEPIFKSCCILPLNDM